MSSFEDGLQVLEEIAEHWRKEKIWLDELTARLQDLVDACRDWKDQLEEELKGVK